MGNGLEALVLILKGYGIGKGDEVIVPANTYIATWLAVSYAGLRLRFPWNRTLKPAISIRSGSRPRSHRGPAAILPVHLYGQTADMDPILKMAKKRKLKVIEDSAQAQGASYKGRTAGHLGDASGIQFLPGQEPRRLRGCRSGDHGRYQTRGPDMHAPQLRFKGKI